MMGNFDNESKQKTMESNKNLKRAKGGGRKLILGNQEDIIYDEIVEMRINKLKVTRCYVMCRARQLAQENNIEDFKASAIWLQGFFKRYHLSLRRTTNLTTLTNEQLVQRAVDYMTYLRSVIPYIDLSQTVLMDETAVYFEDDRTQTIEIQGRRHVVLKSTGFASMRITVVAAVKANGTKVPPLIIHKGSDTIEPIVCHSGPILTTTQSKAWVNQELLMKWIDYIFKNK